MSLADKQSRITKGLLLIETPSERLDAVIAQGRRWPTVPPGFATEDARVAGCISRVWIFAHLEAGHCKFTTEAEVPLVRGLAALLCRLYDGETPADVVSFEPQLLEILHLHPLLSPQRIHGFTKLREAIRNAADCLRKAEP